MTDEINTQKDNNYWLNAPLYQLDYNAILFLNEKRLPNNIIKIVQENENMPLEELREKAKDALGDDALSFNILLAEKDADQARENLLQNVDFPPCIFSIIYLIAFYHYKYPTAVKVLTHILQYGPHANWNEQVAYNPTLDKQIEKFLLKTNLSQSDLEEVSSLSQQNPTCGTLKCLKTFTMWNNGRRNFANVKHIFCLLEESLDDGIPEKYKYIIYALIFIYLSMGCIWCFELEKRLTTHIWCGFPLYGYFLFPTQAVKNAIIPLVNEIQPAWKLTLLMDAPFTMHDVTAEVNALADQCQVEMDRRIANAKPPQQGCCVWIILSLAGGTALGGTLYWLWTLI